MTEQDEAVRLLRLALLDYTGGLEGGEARAYETDLRRFLATPPPAAPVLDVPNGLLPVRARGQHEIEAAGGWVVGCGAYSEYGCMPTEVRDYIVAVLNARLSQQEDGDG